jgi:putative pyruvate formate lyase activating enzyme
VELIEDYRNCRLCPRECGTDRTSRPGLCGEKDQMRAAYIGPHWGEEPPFTGINGSGTVFFTGCSMRCSFCQNYQISREGVGNQKDVEQLVEDIKAMIERHGVHNINFVTPDHFLPHIERVVELLRGSGLKLPVLFNTSGYQSRQALERAGRFVDIYLPDYKYSDSGLAARLSSCPDYPERALDAIAIMIRQKGFLEMTGATASRGTLVRHLVLPGHVENSLKALSALYIEFGPSLPLSLMSQYHPVRPQRDPNLNRRLRADEFQQVYRHCLELGFENLFVQFPEEGTKEGARPGFVPDFTSQTPFTGHSGVDNNGCLC